MPGQAFEIVLNIAALGIIASWGTIVICQIQLYRWSQEGHPRAAVVPVVGHAVHRLPHVGVPGRRARADGFDPPIGTWTVATLVVIIPALIGGWYAVRGRVLAVAQERDGYTGTFPVVAAQSPKTPKTRTGDALRNHR